MGPSSERGALEGDTASSVERSGASERSSGSSTTRTVSGGLRRDAMDPSEDPSKEPSEEPSSCAVHGQWLEALGLLARGVAHDFNNLLLCIDGHAELLGAGLGPQDPRRRDVEEIQRAVERASELVGWLTSAPPGGEGTADLNGVVRGVERFLARTLEEIELVPILEPELGRVGVDVGRLGRSLVHLVLDARTALGGTGRVTLETAAVLTEGAGPSARLSLSMGAADRSMAPAGSMAQAGSMAPAGEGPGRGAARPLAGWPPGPGLAAAAELARDLGGTFELAGGPGGPACRLLLPLVSRAEDVGTPAAAPASAGRAGGRRALDGEETVLLVEDDEAVRRLACRVLERHGYTVLPAVHGSAALLLCESRSPIHLLLADVVLPHLSGYELARRARERHPELRVLLMTGYADRAAGEAGGEAHRVLDKPFRQHELLEAVRSILDA